MVRYTVQLPAPWITPVAEPANAHPAETALYHRVSFKFSTGGCPALLQSRHGEGADSDTVCESDVVVSAAKRCTDARQAAVELLSSAAPPLVPEPSEQARTRLAKHSMPLFPAAAISSAARGPTAASAAVFEALATQNLLPMTPGDPHMDPRLRLPPRSASGTAPAKPRRTEATHVCYGAHFGTEERPVADALLAFTRATRQRLLYEAQMFPHANDVNAVSSATAFLSALSGYNGIGGAALVTSDLNSTPPQPHGAPNVDNSEASASMAAVAAARLAAAAVALAPGGAYITRLDVVASARTLRLVATAGAAFAHVQLLRPIATSAGREGCTWLLASHRRLLSPEERTAIAVLGGLNTETLVGGAAGGGRGGAAGGAIGVEVPEALRVSFEAACVWEAERAEADLAALRLICEGGDDAQHLGGVGERWGAFLRLEGLSVETRDPHAAWLEDPPGRRRPRPAPRIPAGLAQQVDFSTSESTQPPAASAAPSRPPVSHPLRGHPTKHLTPTSALPSHPSGEPTASVCDGQSLGRSSLLRPTGTAQQHAVSHQTVEPSREGGRGVEGGPEAAATGWQLRGPLMTKHVVKGWEVVAEMRSTAWPPDVPVPRELRVGRFGPKPKHIGRFWNVEAADAAAASALASFLDYLNRPSQSMGNRKRMGVILAAEGDHSDLGLVAGSDGRGGTVPIMFRLRDTQQ